MQKIKVTLHQDGSQTIEVIGDDGQNCLDLTKALEDRLGTPQSQRQMKPEFEASTESVPEIIRESEGSEGSV